MRPASCISRGVARVRDQGLHRKILGGNRVVPWAVTQSVQLICKIRTACQVWWARKPIPVGKLIETNAPKPQEIVPPAFSARRRRAGSADSIGPGSIERERRLAATSRRNKATTFVHKSGKAPLHHRRPHSHRRRAWKRRRDRPPPLGRRP